VESTDENAPRDDDFLDLLPAPYAVALRLEEAGFSPDLIARALGLPADVVGSHLVIAHAKLDALRPEGQAGFE
jgi:DNA-directed RNA polymerase specialized sigma24 family protein